MALGRICLCCGQDMRANADPGNSNVCIRCARLPESEMCLMDRRERDQMLRPLTAIRDADAVPQADDVELIPRY